MTTIAFDGRYLAADTALVIGDTYAGKTSKIIRINDGFLACSGHMQDVVLGSEYIVGYYMGNVPTQKPRLESFGALYVTADSVTQWESGLAPFKIETPCAEGSGWRLAMGVMLAGRTAWEACYIAAQRDIGSRPPVEYVDVLNPDAPMITIGS